MSTGVLRGLRMQEEFVEYTGETVACPCGQEIACHQFKKTEGSNGHLWCSWHWKCPECNRVLVFRLLHKICGQEFRLVAGQFK